MKKHPPKDAVWPDWARVISFADDIGSFEITSAARGAGATGVAGMLGGALGGLALGFFKAATSRYFSEVKLTLHSGEVFRLRAEPLTVKAMQDAFERKSRTA